LFYAHTKGEIETDWQALKEHLTFTSEIAKTISEDDLLAPLSTISGLLHDIGKYSQAFQNRLKGCNKPVDHSTAGAQLLIELAGDNPHKLFISKLLSYCIAGHHSGLPDFGAKHDHPDQPTLLARYKRKVENYSDYIIDFPNLNISLPSNLKLTPSRKNGQFSVSFLVRMLFSILVDADFIETENFMRGNALRGNFLHIDEIEKKYSEFLKTFENPESNINIRRTDLLKTCIQQANLEQGLFTMTIPTGGGKTYTSLAFALKHAKKHRLERIIYCIPYTSIIEQTAQLFRTCLVSDVVLEHHSNFDWQAFEKESTSTYGDNTAVRKLHFASENWDIPIVVTTNVQFFESLFSNRTSKCRKIHSLRRSMIIFDEAQMLPRGYLEPCMMSLAELIINYKTSIIFCTATQPPLPKFFPDQIKPHELISSPEDEYAFFKRVVVKNIGRTEDDEISDLIKSFSKVLCIVNTRKHAKGLFEKINDPDAYHLSTLMCPAHRKAVIAQIRKKLKSGKACRVISTQIMEAGIDLDFPIGLRALAGLDSIVQAAGRVNREQKLETGTLYVFEPNSKFVARIPAYIKQTADIARIIMGQYEDPISIEALNAYYKLLYDIQNPSIFDQKNIMACFEKGICNEPNFDFATASERFKLIEEETISVIIPWNKTARTEINKLGHTEYPASLMRTLQPYTINIYLNEFEALTKSGRIEIILDRFPILVDVDEDIYHPKTGLVIPEIISGNAVFV